MKPAVFASARAADSLFLSKKEFGIQKKESNHLWHNCGADQTHTDRPNIGRW